MPHLLKWGNIGRNWGDFGAWIWLICFGLSRGNGFVRYFFYFLFFQLGAQGAETVQFLNGAAVQALGLSLIAQEKEPGVRLLGDAAETFGNGEVVDLADGDFAAAQAGCALVQGLFHGVDELAVGSEGLVEASGG